MGADWCSPALVSGQTRMLDHTTMTRGLRRNGCGGLARASRVAGVVALTGVALLVATPAFVVDSYGIVQRTVVAVLFGWPVAAGLLVRRRA